MEAESEITLNYEEKRRKEYEEKLRKDIFNGETDITVHLDSLASEDSSEWLWGSLAALQTAVKVLGLYAGRRFSLEHVAKGLRPLFERDCIEEFHLSWRGERDIAGVLQGLGANANKSLKYLYLDDGTLSETASVFLQDVIKNSSSLTYLELSQVTVSPDAMSCLAEGLKFSPALDYIKFFCARIDGCPLLFAALSSNSTIRSIEIYDSKLDYDEPYHTQDEWKAIENAVAKNATLQYLYIDECNLGGAELLCYVFRGLAQNASFQKLEFHRNDIDNYGDAEAVAAFLRQRAAPMNYLDLECSRLGGQSMTIIAEALGVCQSKIDAFHLKNTELGIDDFAAILKALSTNSCRLRSLYMSMNILGNRNGIPNLLASSIQESLAAIRNLQVLDLGYCNLSGSPLLEALLQGLSSNTSIVALNLRENNLTDKDAERIASMLRLNTSLKKLRLYGNKITSHGLNAIARALRGHPLCELDVSHNSITCINELAEVLLSDRLLESLDLGGNKIGDEGVVQLISTLNENQTLKKLSLHGCGMTDDAAVVIGQFLSSRNSSSLTCLKLSFSDLSEVGMRALVDGIKWNSTLEQIDGSYPRSNPFPAETAEIQFYCKLNRIGRKHFIRKLVKDELWSRVLEKVGSEGGAECLFDTLCENVDMLKRRNQRAVERR